MMKQLIDLFYRLGVGVLVCASFYRLFIKIIPATLAHYGFSSGREVIMIGGVVVIILGPILSFLLADCLLRSVTTEQDDFEHDTEIADFDEA